jgi:predicted  nucleic acid-binding Zn-ribbon protein
MICTRCGNIFDTKEANFCPRCGWNLAAISTTKLTIAELRVFETQLSEFLPRLTKMRMRLSTGAGHGSDAAHDLSEKRRLLVVQVERRLEAQLRAIRRRLSNLDALRSASQ